MKTSKDDESTQYSQSSCDVAGSSARFLSKPCFYILVALGQQEYKKTAFLLNYLLDDAVIHRC